MKELQEIKNDLRQLEEMLSGCDGVCEQLVLILKIKETIKKMIRDAEQI